MASTYSPNLRLELIGTGEQQGTWGLTTNTNLGTLLEQAIGGYEDIPVADVGDTTLTVSNGAADQSRNMTLNLSGTLTATRNVICPAIEKIYVVKNATSGGFAVTFKVSGQTGVSIPNGATMLIYVDGFDARQAGAIVGASNAVLATSIELGGTTDTTITRSSAGVIAVEGGVVPKENRANTFTANQEVTGDILQTWAASMDRFLGSKFSTTYELGTHFLEASRETRIVSKAADSTGLISFYTGVTPSERMRIDASGNVGIGGAPTTKLDVRGPSGITSFTGTSKLGFMLRGPATNNEYAGIDFSELNGSLPYARIGMMVAGSGSSLMFGTSNNYASGVTNTAMTIDPSGNLCVGTTATADSAKLHVLGGITQTGTQINFRPGTSTQFELVNRTGAGFDFYVNNAGTLAARIDASGNVGIGTTSMQSTFVVASSSGSAPTNATGNNVARLESTQTAGVGVGPSLVFQGKTGNSTATYGFAAIQGLKTSATANDYSGALAFFTQNSAGGTALTEQMRIDASGNVGIGRTPAYRLDVAHPSSTTGFRVATNSGTAANDAGVLIYNVASATAASRTTYLHIDANGADATGGDYFFMQVTGDNNTYIYNQFSGPMMFGTAGSERMRLTSGGYLYVGSTSQVGTDGTIQVRGISGSSFAAAFDNGSASAGALALNRTDDGAVARFYQAWSGGGVGNISVTATATTYNTASDYRLKEDVKPIADASARIMDLSPVNFAWKINGQRSDGFIAHEAAEVIPEAVTGKKDAVDADGNPIYQGIDQSKIVPLLTAALQESITKIKSLEARITVLEVQ